MKISTKGRYSVTALYELALHYGTGPLPLRRAGLVKSIRGAQGGYMLGREPKDITISEIITTVEGPIAVVDCLLAEASAEDQPCKRACACVTRGIWEKVCDSISEVLGSITLQTLVDNDKGSKHVGCAR